MKQDDLKQRAEFYRDVYYKEHDRSKFYDNSIRFPATLIVIYIGAAFYSFNNFYKQGIMLESIIEWMFIITFGLFCLCTLVTMYYLAFTFHGFTRKYEYLPFTSNLKNHELELYKHHYKYSDKTDFTEKRTEASECATIDFIKTIEDYYVKLTHKTTLAIRPCQRGTPAANSPRASACSEFAVTAYSISLPAIGKSKQCDN